MSIKQSSYYYASSSATLSDGNLNKTEIKKIEINNNGLKDHYYKKSLFENNEEKIIKEDGNKELEGRYININSGHLFKLNSDRQVKQLN